MKQKENKVLKFGDRSLSEKGKPRLVYHSLTPFNPVLSPLFEGL